MSKASVDRVIDEFIIRTDLRAFVEKHLETTSWEYLVGIIDKEKLKCWLFQQGWTIVPHPREGLLVFACADLDDNGNPIRILVPTYPFTDADQCLRSSIKTIAVVHQLSFIEVVSLVCV